VASFGDFAALQAIKVVDPPAFTTHMPPGISLATPTTYLDSAAAIQLNYTTPSPVSLLPCLVGVLAGDYSCFLTVTNSMVCPASVICSVFCCCCCCARCLAFQCSSYGATTRSNPFPTCMMRCRMATSLATCLWKT
jgi:hypothetical protein